MRAIAFSAAAAAALSLSLSVPAAQAQEACLYGGPDPALDLVCGRSHAVVPDAEQDLRDAASRHLGATRDGAAESRILSATPYPPAGPGLPYGDAYDRQGPQAYPPSYHAPAPDYGAPPLPVQPYAGPAVPQPLGPEYAFRPAPQPYPGEPAYASPLEAYAYAPDGPPPAPPVPLGLEGYVTVENWSQPGSYAYAYESADGHAHAWLYETPEGPVWAYAYETPEGWAWAWADAPVDLAGPPPAVMQAQPLPPPLPYEPGPDYAQLPPPAAYGPGYGHAPAPKRFAPQHIPPAPPPGFDWRYAEERLYGAAYPHTLYHVQTWRRESEWGAGGRRLFLDCGTCGRVAVQPVPAAVHHGVHHDGVHHGATAAHTVRASRSFSGATYVPAAAPPVRAWAPPPGF